MRWWPPLFSPHREKVDFFDPLISKTCNDGSPHLVPPQRGLGWAAGPGNPAWTAPPGPYIYRTCTGLLPQWRDPTASALLSRGFGFGLSASSPGDLSHVHHIFLHQTYISHSSVLEYVVGVPGGACACAWRSRWCRDWSGGSGANEGILQAAEITFPLLFFRLALFGFPLVGFSWL